MGKKKEVSLDPWTCSTCGVELAEKYVELAKLLMFCIDDTKMKEILTECCFSKYIEIRDQLPSLDVSKYKW